MVVVMTVGMMMVVLMITLVITVFTLKSLGVGGDQRFVLFSIRIMKHVRHLASSICRIRNNTDYRACREPV